MTSIDLTAGYPPFSLKKFVRVPERAQETKAWPKMIVGPRLKVLWELGGFLGIAVIIVIS